MLNSYRRTKEREERQTINAKYLNPLRFYFYLVENHFRLSEIVECVESEGGRCSELLTVDNPGEVSSKESRWFNGPGCYLVSSVYLAA